MPCVAVTQVLGPVGRDQFTAALNAVHPEGGAKIGYYRQLNLTAFVSQRWQEELSVLWHSTHFNLIDMVGIYLGANTSRREDRQARAAAYACDKVADCGNWGCERQ